MSNHSFRKLVLQNWLKQLLAMAPVALFGCISAPHDIQPGFLKPQEATAIAASRRAGILVDSGKLAEAERNLRIALRAQPNSASVLNSLGFVLMKQDRSEEALSLLLRSRQIQPGYTPATINIARLYAENDDFERALPEWERALTELKSLAVIKDRRLFSDADLQAEIQRTYQGLSAVYAGLGMFDEALCYSGLALQTQSNLQTVASHSRLLMAAGHFQQAESLLDQLFGKMQVEDVPTSISLDYAVTLFQQHQFKRSASTLAEITQDKAASNDEATVASLLERILPGEGLAITAQAESGKASGKGSASEESPTFEPRCSDKLLARYSHWPPAVLDRLKAEETKVCADENKSVTPAVS